MTCFATNDVNETCSPGRRTGFGLAGAGGRLDGAAGDDVCFTPASGSGTSAKVVGDSISFFISANKIGL